MSQNVAPWLAGLDDDVVWEDTPTQAVDSISSASHNANSIRSTRNPHHRSLSGLPGSMRTNSSQGSTQKRRSPLATLTNSNSNSIRRPDGSTKLMQSRSFSGAGSDESVIEYGTVQQRSKSASPAKKQGTMEWKKRLLRGEVGYGDHTDLFGPSGLENIFAQSRPTENTPKKTRSSMNWLDRSSAMPSSPPPWPARANQHEPISEHEGEDEEEIYEREQSHLQDRLTTVDEERESRATGQVMDDSSFRSNPFDLRHSEEPQSENSGDAEEIYVEDSQQQSSPDRHLMEPTQDNIMGNRTVSGQTDLDDFSPVFISKHTTMNGQVEYKALDSRIVKQFQRRTVDLRHPSQDEQTSDAPQTHDEAYAEESAFTDGPESDALPIAPDLSLSENLPTGTPPVSTLGKNVQLNRGGYSAQGSFKDRPLSSSQSRADLSPVRESSELLSPSAAADRSYPHAPTTPSNKERADPRSRSSGSPLKLFGPHDTFTSNRLLRRMSQLDPDLSQIRSEDVSDVAAESPFDGEKSETDRKVSSNSFGSGELNGHGFNAEITITSASDSDKAGSDRSPGSEVPPPGSKTPLGFRFEDMPIANDTFKLKRKLSKRSDLTSKNNSLESAPRHLQPTVEDASEAPTRTEVRVSDTAYTASKRPPNSPFKAPTPKRRRTLHADDLHNEGSEVARSYHSQLQDVLGSRKRRESRQDHLHDVAHQDVLAQRKIARPRNPTPSQLRREELEAQIRETAEQFAAQEPQAMEAVLEQIESSMASDTPPSVQQQANVVASEVAKFSLRIQKASGDQTERKKSLTTKDFFNEAVLVMELIRKKAGRQSGLGSVAESAQEGITEGFEEGQFQQDSSELRVSRPPSREGGSKWRPRRSEPTDARVISHLRKFQEKDDTEFIAQSEASLHMDEEQEQVVVVDEHCNVRIKGPLHTHQQAEDDPSRPSTQHSQQSQQSSVASSTQDSAASSTGRTFISRKSQNVGNLAPDAVAHLIGEHVGAMTYDNDKQQWVKAKSPKKQQYGSFLEPPSNITSDDDPFREISDLPVDERKEEEIRKASSTGRRLSVQPAVENENGAKATEQNAEQPAESRITSQETVLARPTTRDTNKSHHTFASSDPSRWTGFASSQQQTVETRATSWGDEDLYRLATKENAHTQPLAYAAAQAALALAERNEGFELARQYTEGTTTSCPTVPSHTLNPNGAEGIEEECIEESLPEESDVLAELRDNTVAGADQSGVELLQSPKLRQSPSKTQYPPSSTYRGAARQMSLRRKTLKSRFNDPDAMEQSEVSFVAALPGDRTMSVSLSVSRPLSKRHPQGHVMEAPSSPTKYDPSFMLSDLPDFTIHEEDRERPSERALAERLAQHAAAEVNDRYALSIKDMVKTLTDVKEEEPRWDLLRQLDLHDRSLGSLHGLDEFCERVQDMDASDNKLLYLNGAPTSLRQLVARSNQLSSLTSWTHLMNLQYLDISGNRLENVDGLGCLFHLRELRADDNQIANIDGIMQLDGLLKLRLRRNKVQVVDFERNQLHRLEDLDLCGNNITTLQHVGSLGALESLKLDGNPLVGFTGGEHEMPRMKHLSLKHCGLQRLNVSGLPSLQALLVDGNSVTTIEGIGKLRSLDLLSMRKQSLVQGLEIMILEQDLHARTVRLSGNDMPTLRLPKSLLSVKHLEIASAGLQELPDDFGLMLPNLTTLNLNFNSLKDVRPVLNIQKLQHLSVCGNRLERLRKTLATLSKLSTLTSVDLRDNPVTHGFYAPHTCAEPQTSVVRRARPEPDEEDEDTAAEKLEAARYVFPPGDASHDAVHHARMDEDTKLRRRVYHLLLGNICKAIEHVDGLAFDKTGATAKDKTWDRLVELNIVRKTGAMGLKNEVDSWE